VTAELSAVLALSALQNNDKVGLFLFTDGVEEFVPAQGRKHVLHLIRDILAFSPVGRGTRIESVLDAANRVLRRRCILFLISDFQDAGFEKALKLASLKHDLIPIVVTDPRETELPSAGGYLELTGPETGQRTLVEARKGKVLSELARLERERLATLERLFTVCGLDSIRVGTDRSAIEAIIGFFRRRARRIRR
jgi:uncharacterized protein (DUF58 family)